jgi:hypothetical protein
MVPAPKDCGKVMRISLPIVACAVICAVSTPCSGAHHTSGSAPKVKLEFGAVPNKPVYRLGEVIEFTFSLRNLGSTDVLVARRFVLNKYVWLEITGPDKKELPWCGKIDGRIGEFAKLEPRAEIHSLVRISCNVRRDSGFVFDRPGTYKVSAYYHMPEPVQSLKRIAGTAIVTTSPIRAKPTTITIVP